MEKLSDKNPCLTCKEDKQVGNPYSWQTPCHTCTKPKQWRDECLKKLAEYEEIEERAEKLISQQKLDSSKSL